MHRRIVLSTLVLWMYFCCVGTSLGQGPHLGPTQINCTTPDQCLSVQQSGSGSGTVSNTTGSIPQPSPTHLPPAGVTGNGTSSSGSSAGVLGTSAGNFGLGVLGIATGTPGPNDNPSGIVGIATAGSGKTRGVTAIISSPDGAGLNISTTGGKFIESSNGSGPSGFFFDVDGSGNIATTGVISVGIAPGGGSDLFHVDQFGNVQAQGNIQGGQGIYNSLQVNGGNLSINGGNINTGAGTVTTHAVSAQDSDFSGSVTINQLNATQGNISGNAGVGGMLVVTGNLNAQSQLFAGDTNVGSLTTTGNGGIGGNLHVNGNLNVNGTKSSIAAISGGRRVALYAVESPENWFEDFGTAKLDRGKVQVKLESVFAETVNADLDYHVFLTPNGNCRGLYIAEKTATGFVVRELGGGKSNISFDYRVVVRRKGYEKVRLAGIKQ